MLPGSIKLRSACHEYQHCNVQAAKQERKRQFNAAERERKSKNKSAAELAYEQREAEVRQRQEVRALINIVHPNCIRPFVGVEQAAGRHLCCLPSQ